MLSTVQSQAAFQKLPLPWLPWNLDLHHGVEMNSGFLLLAGFLFLIPAPADSQHCLFSTQEARRTM